MDFRIAMESAVVRAAEAEELTGVAQTLQRDWRRREIIAGYTGPGHVRYPLYQVCELKVMMILSEARISVKFAKHMVNHVSMMVAAHIRRDIDHAEFLGADDLTDAEKTEIVAKSNPASSNSLFMFRIPELKEGDQRTSVYISNTWEGLNEMAAKDGGISTVLVLDSAGIAREIIAAAKRPLVTYRLIPEGKA